MYGLSKITVTATDQSGDSTVDDFFITINPVTDSVALEDDVIDINEGATNEQPRRKRSGYQIESTILFRPKGRGI